MADRPEWNTVAQCLFDKYDLLVAPAQSCPSCKIGLDNPTSINGVRLATYE